MGALYIVASGRKGVVWVIYCLRDQRRCCVGSAVEISCACEVFIRVSWCVADWCRRMRR
jgi:hypothetical protein